MKQGQGKRLLIGLIAVFALFQWTASALGSDRGQAGVVVGLIVAAAVVFAEKLLFAKSFKEAARAVGLKRPTGTGLLTATVISVLMLLAVFVFASATSATFGFYPGWYWLVPGLFFQAGIAEETLFRGYLFGHLRQRHTFGKAAVFAAVPFVLVHLILFYQLSWSLAGASILLSVAMSFPLSRLFELDGDSVISPAVLHFFTQGMVKILVASGDAARLFPFFWIAVSAVLPLLVYFVPLQLKRIGRKPVRAASPALFLVCFLAFPAIGQDNQTPKDTTSENDFWSRDEMTGDWNGERARLREKGIDLKFRLTQYYQYVSAGGAARRDAYGAKLDTHFRLDLEKLVGWKRLSVQIKTETRFGRSPSVGAALPLNAGIISPKSEGAAISVTALNFTQVIPIGENDSIAVGAGKYYSLDSSREPFTGGAGVTKFMNVASNGNPAVGRTVPTVTNGATFAWLKKGAPFISFAVFDPNASATRTGLKKLFRDGVTFVSGISLPTNFGRKSGRHSFSGTVTTKKFTPFDQLAQFIVPGSPSKVVVPKSGSWSLTYTFHQYIRENRTADGQKTGFGIFGTFTVADKTTNPVGEFMTFGLGGNGLFKKRQRDGFGVAYGFTGVSRDLRTALSPLLKIRDEHSFETFYNFSITPWMWLTGDVQIIRPVLKSAGLTVVPGVRLEMHF